MEKSAGLLEMYIFFPYGVILASFIGFLGHYTHHRGKGKPNKGLTN